MQETPLDPPEVAAQKEVEQVPDASGCDCPSCRSIDYQRAMAADSRLRRPEGFTPAELCRRAPDDGARELTIVESFDVD